MKSLVEVSDELHLEIKMHCIANGIKLKEFMTAAIEEKAQKDIQTKGDK